MACSNEHNIQHQFTEVVEFNNRKYYRNKNDIWFTVSNNKKHKFSHYVKSTCMQCNGIAFKAKWSINKNTFCSQACVIKAKTGKGNQTRPVTDFYVESKQCRGVTYYKNKDDDWFTVVFNKGERKFLYYRETFCSVCNNITFVDKYRYDKSIAKRSFCSETCLSIGNMGAGNLNWVGGRRLHGRYWIVYSPNHPNARSGYVAEHRLAIENELGRYLRSDEVVHHIDCDKQNNELLNLITMSIQQHSKSHGTLEKCVAALIKSGAIRFNRKTLSYEVKETICEA